MYFVFYIKIQKKSKLKGVVKKCLRISYVYLKKKKKMVVLPMDFP